MQDAKRLPKLPGGLGHREELRGEKRNTHGSEANAQCLRGSLLHAAGVP